MIFLKHLQVLAKTTWLIIIPCKEPKVMNKAKCIKEVSIRTYSYYELRIGAKKFEDFQQIDGR